jgi:hypothetical protein
MLSKESIYLFIIGIYKSNRKSYEYDEKFDSHV